MFEEGHSDVLRINPQQNSEMTLLKDIKKERTGFSTIAKRGNSSYFIMKLSKYSGKKT